MDKAEQILEKHINENDLNFIFHEKKDLWQELLNAVNEALRIHDVVEQSEQLKGEYTEHFIEWRDKYFDYNPILVEWKTKKRNERYTTKQILSRYERAMLKSPFNCHYLKKH